MSAVGGAIVLSLAWSLCSASDTSELPIWEGRSIAGDTLFFVQKEGKPYAQASLLFASDRTPALFSATGDVEYRVGRDFTWEKDSRTITLTRHSRIPFKTRAELYPAAHSPNSIDRARGQPGDGMLFSEGHFFHDLQVVASYDTSERWSGFTPQSKVALLPRITAKTKGGESIRLIVLGDSISAGYNASAKTDVKPYSPAYPARVVDGLKKMGAGRVELINLSISGMTSAWGVTQISQVISAFPDLAIIAFGMNDADGVTPPELGDNTRQMIEAIRKDRPNCEFILVAGMIDNPDWVANQQSFLDFRDELLKLEGNGVAVADVTSLWLDLMRRKSFYDLTGNGVNHPNDLGHRIYAEVILKLLNRE